MSGHMIWFEMEVKNRNFCLQARLPLYIGLAVESVAGCANPIIPRDLRFTLEIATFALVIERIA